MEDSYKQQLQQEQLPFVPQQQQQYQPQQQRNQEQLTQYQGREQRQEEYILSRYQSDDFSNKSVDSSRTKRQRPVPVQQLGTKLAIRCPECGDCRHTQEDTEQVLLRLVTKVDEMAKQIKELKEVVSRVSPLGSSQDQRQQQPIQPVQLRGQQQQPTLPIQPRNQTRWPAQQVLRNTPVNQPAEYRSGEQRSLETLAFSPWPELGTQQTVTPKLRFDMRRRGQAVQQKRDLRQWAKQVEATPKATTEDAKEWTKALQTKDEGHAVYVEMAATAYSEVRQWLREGCGIPAQAVKGLCWVNSKTLELLTLKSTKEAILSALKTVEARVVQKPGDLQQEMELHRYTLLRKKTRNPVATEYYTQQIKKIKEDCPTIEPYKPRRDQTSQMMEDTTQQRVAQSQSQFQGNAIPVSQLQEGATLFADKVRQAQTQEKKLAISRNTPTKMRPPAARESSPATTMYATAAEGQAQRKEMKKAGTQQQQQRKPDSKSEAATDEK